MLHLFGLVSHIAPSGLGSMELSGGIAFMHRRRDSVRLGVGVSLPALLQQEKAAGQAVTQGA